MSESRFSALEITYVRQLRQSVKPKPFIIKKADYCNSSNNVFSLPFSFPLTHKTNKKHWSKVENVHKSGMTDKAPVYHIHMCLMLNY